MGSTSCSPCKPCGGSVGVGVAVRVGVFVGSSVLVAVSVKVAVKVLLAVNVGVIDGVREGSAVSLPRGAIVLTTCGRVTVGSAFVGSSVGALTSTVSVTASATA